MRIQIWLSAARTSGAGTAPAPYLVMVPEHFWRADFSLSRDCVISVSVCLLSGYIAVFLCPLLHPEVPYIGRVPTFAGFRTETRSSATSLFGDFP